MPFFLPLAGDGATQVEGCNSIQNLLSFQVSYGIQTNVETRFQVQWCNVAVFFFLCAVMNKFM